MTLETKGEFEVHIVCHEERGILVPRQSPWNMPILPIKKSGTFDSLESDSSRETGVHSPERCILQSPIGKGKLSYVCI